MDFEHLRQFTLFPKNGLTTRQVIAVVFPPKEKHDFRLLFRFIRTMDSNNKQLPASFVVGMERATPDNIEALKRIEKGGSVDLRILPAPVDGFRIHVFPLEGDIETQGAFLQHPVAKNGTVTIYYGPLGVLGE